MKKFVASVGLVVIGVSGAQATEAPGIGSTTPAKPWSVSATLRGFYDDNVNTAVNGTPKQDSFGFEVSPALGFGFSPSPQTHLDLTYLYSFKWYDHTPAGNSEPYDQTHSFNAALDHAFSERYKLVVSDSFVIGQEPDFLRAGNSFSTFQRISGNNIRNYGSIAINAQVTRLLGFEVGYNNAYYDYSAHGLNSASAALNEFADATNPSASGTLDRMEHTVHLDSKWVLQPETVGVFGYQFRTAEYLGNEAIGVVLRPVVIAPLGSPIPVVIHSSDRNYDEHYMYIGVDHSFLPNLAGSARVGARYIDFYNDPTGNGNGWGPYVMLNLSYIYAPESRLEFGVTHDINTTDVTGAPAAISGNNVVATSSSFTAYSETTVVYGSIKHRITPHIRGSLIGQFQNSTYKGGNINNSAEQDYLVGLNLAYDFTAHLSAEVGYNYDKLNSDIGRSFDRNRVYIGATASY